MNEVLGQRSNFDRILDLCEDNHASIEVDQSRPTIWQVQFLAALTHNIATACEENHRQSKK